MAFLQKILLKALVLREERRRRVSSKPVVRGLDPRGVKRVLVVSSTAIGDTLFATPGIRALKRLLPWAELDFLVRDKVLPLFSIWSPADSLLSYKGHYRNAISLLRTFKRRNYGLCVVFHDSDPCPVETAYAAGIPFIFRIGQRDKGVARLLTYRIPYDKDKHAIDQRLQVIRKIFDITLDSSDDLRMEYPLKDSEVTSLWQDILMKKVGVDYISDNRPKLVGFQFSASGGYKEWPGDNFVALAQRLLEYGNNSRVKVVLIGGPGDRDRANVMEEKIQRDLPADGHLNVINLAGEHGLEQLPLVVKGLDILVTNDTGPLHVAIAVGTPTVSLFVPSNVQGTGPIQDLEIHKAIVKPKPCTPCVEKYCKDPNCMGLISVDEVFKETLGLLEKVGSQSS